MWGNSIVRGAVAVAVASALAACSAVTGGAGTPGARAGHGSLQGDGTSLSRYCPPSGAPAAYDVDALNAWMASLPGTPLWQAGDIGFTLPLSGGRTVWVFGDTLRSRGHGARFAANSMLVSSGQCVAQVVPDDEGTLIRTRDGHSVCWPTSGVVMHGIGQDRLIVSCSRVDRGDGPLDFTYLGSTLAWFEVSPSGVPSLTDVRAMTPDNRDPLQINWGSAMLRDHDWIYVYGTRLSAVGSSSRSLYVARAPVGAVANFSTWRYWDGDRWQADRAAAAAVLPASDGVSQTLTVDRVGDTYVAVSKVGGDFSTTIGVWSAGSPVGPWHLEHTRQEPGAGVDGVMTYAPIAHPDLPLADGHLLVSVSRNPSEVRTLLHDPRLGRPVFLEVPMP